MDLGLSFIGIVAALASKQILGMIWYTVLFGKLWKKLVKLTETEIRKGMVKGLVADFLSNLSMAFVLAMGIRFTGATTLSQAVAVAFWCWAGFVVPTSTGLVFFERVMPLRLFWIKNSFQLISMVIMALILVSLG